MTQPFDPYRVDPLSKDPARPSGAQPPPGTPAQNTEPGFGPPAQPGYGPPAQPGYGPPAQSGYGPPAQSGYGPPAQPGYGPPAQPGYGPRYPAPGLPNQAYPPVKPTNGLAVAGVICATFALVLSWVPFVNFLAILLGVVGLVLSIVGLAKANRGASGKGLAISGIVTGAVATVISIAMALAYVFLWDSIDSTVDDATPVRDWSTVNPTPEPLDLGVGSEDVDESLGIELGTLELGQVENGWADSSMMVTVTNTGDENHTFIFTVEALDADGEVIDLALVSTKQLAPGESVQEEIFTIVVEEDVEAMRTATFQTTSKMSF